MISQQENVIDDILAPTAVGCRPRVGLPSTQSTTTPSTRHIGTCLVGRSMTIESRSMPDTTKAAL